MSEHPPSLAQRMRHYIATHGLPPDHVLVQAAEELEAATIDASSFDSKRILAAWARARLLWRNATGEALV